MRTAAALALGCGACRPSVYVCTEDEQCATGQLVGLCQGDGRCSFPDDACPSGQRYGDHVGSMAGECVAPMAGTESTTAGTSSMGDGPVSLDGTNVTNVEPITVTASTGTADSATGTTRGASSSESTTGGPIDLDPLLWFAFEGDGVGGIANLGSLGGVAACDEPTCPSPTAGAVGAAVQFDGIDDCAIFPFADQLAMLDALTISAWLRREPIPNYACVLCKPVGVDPWNTWRLATYDNAEAIAVADFRLGMADNTGVSLPAPIALSTWTHVVGTWDGANMVLWIDGAIVLESENSSYEVDEQPVYLGCDDDHGRVGITNFLAGAIDEVRLYGRVLEPDEIAALAMGG
jgi:Concanavalin A-like lectin/glucanases superfamily